MFQALSKIPAPERTALTTMTDKELAAVEGASFGCNVLAFCSNYANVSQANINVLSVLTFQSNSALVLQSND